jgi:hypothetical protein
MSIGTATKQLRPVTPVSTWKTFKLAHQRASVLGRPTVLTLLSPAPITARALSGLGEDPPSAWDSTNKAIQSLSTVVGAGTNFYASQQQNKLLQQQADAAAAKTEAAQRAADLERATMLENQRLAATRPMIVQSQGMPSWVLPVAIGGVLLAAVGGYFLLKKKAV